MKPEGIYHFKKINIALKPFRIWSYPINLVIIGAQKCGTTSLHHYLDQHPQILMSQIKEPGFFLSLSERKAIHPHKNPSTFRLFRHNFRNFCGQKILGESTTHYTMAPFRAPDTPEIMQKLNPNLKLIYLIRHPLDRIISQYKFTHRRFKKKFLGVNDFINQCPNSMSITRYYFQLQRFLKYFPSSQIKIIILEELSAFPDQIFDDINNFLGVDQFKYNLSKIHNRAPKYACPGNINTQLSPKILGQIRNKITPDLKSMEKFLGRSLDLWKYKTF